MRLKTILNRIEKHQGFLYDAVRLEEEGRRLVIEVAIRPRAHSRPTCSGCREVAAEESHGLFAQRFPVHHAEPSPSVADEGVGSCTLLQ